MRNAVILKSPSCICESCQVLREFQPSRSVRTVLCSLPLDHVGGNDEASRYWRRVFHVPVGVHHPCYVAPPPSAIHICRVPCASGNSPPCRCKGAQSVGTDRQARSRAP